MPFTVSVVWIAQLLEAFTSVGLDAELLCRGIGIDPALVANPQARLPRDTSGRLWRLALARSGDPLLGLIAGEQMQWSMGHVFPLLLFTAPSLAVGLESLRRYQETLLHDRVISLQGAPGNRRVRFSRVEEDLPILDQEVEYATVAALRLFQAATAKAFRFRAVTFPHRPLGAVDEYERVLGCPVVFGAAHTEWHLTEESLGFRITHRNPALQAQLAVIAADLSRSARRESCWNETREHIRAGLAVGRFGIADVSEAMHTTARTLQRRLTAEGSSFREALDDVRRTIVLLGLERGLRLEDTMHLAGFTDLRSLRRAMSRWRIPVEDNEPTG